MQYIALLRGINVGGNNIIKMADLTACFTDMGFDNIKTYIQSGNVIFSSTKTLKQIESTIAKNLAKTFDYTNPVVVIKKLDLASIIKNAPRGYGKKPTEYRYDVIFLKPPLTAKKALPQIKTREGVDAIHPGKNVLYFSRLISQATKSYMPKIVMLPMYKQMTIRNWNTTTKLLALLS